nr:uncharacterized protein LOC119160743 [Rhipicephalus microplus]
MDGKERPRRESSVTSKLAGMASSSWRKRQLDKLATLVECSRVSSRQAGLLTAWVADMVRESCGTVDTAPGAVAATDLTGTSLGRSSRNGSAYTLYEDEDGVPVFPEPESAPSQHPSASDSQQPPRHRGSLSGAQSVPFGISELGNDDSSPDEKKDVYARFFARKTRTLEKASPGSSKQKAVKSLRSKGRDLSLAHRSKSLTQIDCLESGMSRRDDEPSGGSSPSDASGQPQSLQSQPSQSSPSHQPPPSPDRLSVPDEAPPQRSRLRHSSREQQGQLVLNLFDTLCWKGCDTNTLTTHDAFKLSESEVVV